MVRTWTVSDQSGGSVARRRNTPHRRGATTLALRTSQAGVLACRPGWARAKQPSAASLAIDHDVVVDLATTHRAKGRPT